MAAKGSQGRSGPGSRAGAKAGPRPNAAGSRPQPSPSKAVYRRRRLALVLVLGLAAAGLVWAGFALAGVLAGNSGENDASAADPFQSAPSSSASAPSSGDADSQSTDSGDTDSGDQEPRDPDDESAAADPACPASAVKVGAATDAAVYAAGTNPLLTLSVTNTGTEPCEINVGTTQMEFIVTSGSDRIFSSADCQDGGADLVREFAPGATESANFTWERLRSAPGCTAVASNPNPGWYVFTARLGQSTSEKAVFQLD